MYPVMRRSIETTDLCLTGKFSNTLTRATWFFRHTADTEIDGYRFFMCSNRSSVILHDTFSYTISHNSCSTTSRLTFDLLSVVQKALPILVS